MRLDLHRHLEGSHSPAALAQVARRFELRDPVFFDASAQRFRTAEELGSRLTMAAPTDDASVFYECIKAARAAYVSLEAIGELSRLAFLEAAEDADDFEMRVSLFSMTRTLLEHEGVRFRELAPIRFAERARAVLLRVLAARDAARAAFQGRKQLLVRVGFSRTFESEPHYRALAEILPEHRAALSGLDVLGIVTGADKEPLQPALRAILERLRQDLPDLTIHAGEFEDHASVQRALALAPQGIGHGVHSVGDAQTLALLARTGVTLELCVTSNRMLIPSAMGRLEQAAGAHPLVALQRSHVHCVLGSDDPTPLGTRFGDELRRALALGADPVLLERDGDRRWAQLLRR